MKEDFDSVKLIFPNEWRKNISSITNEKICEFGWFLFSQRIYDREKNLYYIEVSSDVQFYCEKTGKTLVISPDKESSRLLILSEPHNKRILCKNYGFLCGCDSGKEMVSVECELLSKSNLKKGFQESLKLGYDGIVVKHECLKPELSSLEGIVCQNITLVFTYGILKCLGENHPERCAIVKYSKKNNSRISKIIKQFPSCQEIDELLEGNDCEDVSFVLYEIINMYLKRKFLEDNID